MRAISVLSFETGTSTRWCLAAAALRRRVRKSAIGSVCMYLLSWHRLPRRLPAGFHDTGDFPLQRHTAETDSAHLKLADIPSRAAAAAAAVADPHLEFRLLERLSDFCCACHLLRHPFFAERKPEPFEQLTALLIVLRAGRHGDVHAFDLVDARVINLWKHQLVLQPQRVIPAAVKGILRQAAKVAHTGEHHVAQAVEKFIHVVAAQRLHPVFFLQSTLHRLLCLVLYLSNVVLQCRQLRTFVPSGNIVWPIRVCLPQLPQTTSTFETLIPASFSTIPPLMFFEGLGRVCRLMMPTCSTTTVSFFALIESTRPLLPASFPAITRTLSPLRI